MAGKNPSQSSFALPFRMRGGICALAASPHASFTSSTETVRSSASFLTVIATQPSKGMAARWAKKLVIAIICSFS
ncbi:hypothetical protein NU09_0859 [Flavobacterium beibuense]|uniref:Uncharacterized protein n=1 Tax=Flavobacterium beibuense TaxID=657326 RepID=A0A444WEL2_9FLAO|nr:hypothetical protein NU09_0859 [Flavobacterium beibuense]